MTEAVIVSTARSPIGKAYRGALNNTEGPTMAGHVIGEAVRRAKVEPDEVEDVVMGCAMQQGTTAMNVARNSRATSLSSSAVRLRNTNGKVVTMAATVRPAHRNRQPYQPCGDFEQGQGQKRTTYAHFEFFGS